MEQVKIVKEGYIRKRKAKLYQWSTRYFTLNSNHTISYKIKKEQTEAKESYDLVPGCIVTPIEVEARATWKGKKLFSFWVVWPHDKLGGHNPSHKDHDKNQATIDSDDEKDPKDVTPHVEVLTGEEYSAKCKNLKSIVENEVWVSRRQKDIVEEQIEMHHARDNNITLGAKVAAVTVGGVIIGGVTAGIGLLPYLAVVGVAAMAGGGAVAFNWRKPFDSRLILSCDTMDEALEWKLAIETQVSFLESKQKQRTLPSGLNPRVISAILDRSSSIGYWKRVCVREGIRILEHVVPRQKNLTFTRSERFRQQCEMFCRLFMFRSSNSKGLPLVGEWCLLGPTIASSSVSDGLNSTTTGRNNRCRRAHQAIDLTPIKTFLTLMETPLWPAKEHGTNKRIKIVDDHADVLQVEINLALHPQGDGPYVKLCVNRFWTLDEDGIYLITFSSGVTGMDDYPPERKERAKDTFVPCPAPDIHAVITVAPRADFADHEYDVNDAMVSCSCQLSIPTGAGWREEEQAAFMDLFIRDHLLELKYMITNDRFTVHDEHVIIMKEHGHSTHIASLLCEESSSEHYHVIPGASSAASASGSFYPYPTSYPSSSGLSPAAPGGATRKHFFPTDQSPSTSFIVTNDGLPPTAAKTGKRGVTTVQPGMEDFPPNVNTDSADEEIKPNTTTAAAVVPKKRLRDYFSRSKTSKENNTVTSSHHSLPNPPTAASTAAASANAELSTGSNNKRSASPAKLPLPRSTTGDQQPTTGTMFRSFSPAPPNRPSDGGGNFSDTEQLPANHSGKKDRHAIKEAKRERKKAINAEAMKLRESIEAREFELKRLSETIKAAKGLQGGKERLEKLGITPAQFSLLQGQHLELSTKLATMKMQYGDLTGCSYEDAKHRRSGLRRLWGSRRPSATNAKDGKEGSAKDGSSHLTLHSPGNTTTSNGITELLLADDNSTSPTSTPSREAQQHARYASPFKDSNSSATGSVSNSGVSKPGLRPSAWMIQTRQTTSLHRQVLTLFKPVFWRALFRSIADELIQAHECKGEQTFDEVGRFQLSDVAVTPERDLIELGKGILLILVLGLCFFGVQCFAVVVRFISQQDFMGYLLA